MIFHLQWLSSMWTQFLAIQLKTYRTWKSIRPYQPDSTASSIDSVLAQHFSVRCSYVHLKPNTPTSREYYFAWTTFIQIQVPMIFPFSWKSGRKPGRAFHMTIDSILDRNYLAWEISQHQFHNNLLFFSPIRINTLIQTYYYFTDAIWM